MNRPWPMAIPCKVSILFESNVLPWIPRQSSNSYKNQIREERTDVSLPGLALTLRALDRWWVGGASLDIQGGCLCWRQEGLDGAYVTRMTSDGSDSVPTLTTWPSPGVKPHKQRREGGGEAWRGSRWRESRGKPCFSHLMTTFHQTTIQSDRERRWQVYIL